MTPQQPDSTRDPLGCRSGLARALARKELTAFSATGGITRESEQAALWLAVALGRCRLFGVELEPNGMLPCRVAAAAARECMRQLGAEGSWLPTLNEWRSEGSGTQPESDPTDHLELLCANLLSSRMNYWAACVAIDEAHAGHLQLADPALSELERTIGELAAAVDHFDIEMQQHLERLCIVTSTELLANWRVLLTEPFRAHGPWWLDGRLEREWARIRSTVEASLPRKLRAVYPILRTAAPLPTTASEVTPTSTKGGDVEIGKLLDTTVLLRSISVPNPKALAASAEENPPQFTSPGGRLIVWVHVDEGFHFEVCTRDKSLNADLVRYELVAPADTRLVGYLAFHPDRNDWYSAQVGFTLEELHALSGGHFPEGSFRLVDVSDVLTRGESAALIESARRSRHEPRMARAWATWASTELRRSAQSDSGDVKMLARRVLEVVGTADAEASE